MVACCSLLAIPLLQIVIREHDIPGIGNSLVHSERAHTVNSFPLANLLGVQLVSILIFITVFRKREELLMCFLLVAFLNGFVSFFGKIEILNGALLSAVWVAVLFVAVLGILLREMKALNTSLRLLDGPQDLPTNSISLIPVAQLGS